jgi:hypothetical protein
MSKNCFTCNAHTVLDCCSKCQAVQYCSKSCQKADWKQHKQICQYLNVGDGAMQVRTDKHVDSYAEEEEQFQAVERSFDEDEKRFFKLFTESTHEGSLAAAQEMKKIAAQQIQCVQQVMMFYSISILMRTDSKKLRWPNSPLRIMLLFVDANVRLADAEEEESREELATGPTPIHHLSGLADPKDHSFHILGQQLFRHGANLDATPEGRTPLHLACHSISVTNLDFIQLLLEKGANPNAQGIIEDTTLMSAVPDAPGAAKFLLEWSTPPTTDIDIHIIINRFGVTVVDMVHGAIEKFSNPDELADNPDKRVKHAFLLQQWCEIEEMLVERGSH